MPARRGHNPRIFFRAKVFHRTRRFGGDEAPGIQPPPPRARELRAADAKRAKERNDI